MRIHDGDNLRAVDIEHAATHAIRRVDLDDERVLLIGPDRSARLLEVVVVDLETDEPTVVRSMPLRPKFRRTL